MKANTAPAYVSPQLEAATELRALGRIAEAEQLYADIFEQDPMRAALGLGHCRRRRSDHAGALAWFRQAMAANISKTYVSPQLEAATELRALGRIAEAEQLYTATIAQDPMRAALGLAHCAGKRGDSAGALALFQEAMREGSKTGNHEPHLALAKELKAQGRIGEAEALYRTVLAHQPHATTAMIGIGLCARYRGQNEQALACFNQAAEHTAAGGTQAAIEAINELCLLGRFDQAEQQAQMLDRRGTSPAVLATLARVARAAGLRAVALARFQLAESSAATAGDQAAALSAALDAATEQWELGEVDAALARLDGLAAAYPADPRAPVQRARMLRLQDRPEEALEAAQHALALFPAHAQALLELADVLRALGRPDDARSHLDQLLAQQPNQPRALTAMAELARLSLDYEGAEEILQRAAAETPDHAAAHLAVAGLVRQLGRLDEAMASLDAAERISGALPEITRQRITTLREMGQWQAALARAREATAASPWHMGLWEQRLQLELIEGDDAIIAACFAAIPAATMREAALLAHLRGLHAAARWRLDEAIAHQRQAARLNPLHSGAVSNLGRVSLLLLDIAGSQDNQRKSIQLAASVHRLQGRSSNISQSFLGQLTDEVRIDAATLALLRPLLAEPPALRVASLLDLQRRLPDSTAVAVQLLIALRQAGALDLPRPQMPQAIPRRITQFWDSPDPPESLRPLLDSWQVLNPGYSYQLFNTQTAWHFLQSSSGPAAATAFARAREPAKKADIFRLAYLAVAGGIYVDSDDRCLAPLDDWLPAAPILVGYQEDLGTLANNFLAAAPGSPVILQALRSVVTAVNRGDADVLWLSTGPGAISRAFAQVMAEQGSGALGWLRDVAILDRYSLLRVIHTHAKAAYKVTNRHWTNTALGRSNIQAPNAQAARGV